MSLPLTNYYQNSGFSDLSEAQPRSFVRWKPDHRTVISYDALQELLLVSMPGENCALVLQGGAWSLWHFESACNSTLTEVGRLENLPEPHLHAIDGRVFAVCGPEITTPADQVDPAENNPTYSYIVAEWGRGGGIDRTVEAEDDQRLFAGYWRHDDDVAVTAGTEGGWFFGPPVEMPDNFDTPRSGAPSSGVFMVPVWAMPDFGGTYDQIDIRFTFDNTQWQPVFVGATPELDFCLPAERDPSRAGWGYGAPVAGTREIQCYDAGVPATTGNEIRMLFNGAVGGWTHAPELNLAEEHINPLLWLPFIRLLTGQTYSMDLDFSKTSIWSASEEKSMSAWVWHFAAKPPRHTADDVAQPVDWYLGSGNKSLGKGEPRQVRLRTLYLRGTSHAQTPDVYATWPRGLLNVAFSSDSRQWSSQIVDYLEGAESSQTKVPFRTRLRDNSGDMANKVFGTDAKWGDSGDSTDGNVLIDDEQFDVTSISDSIRGQRVRVAMFGHQRGVAERLVIESADAAVELVGSRRRRGR